MDVTYMPKTNLPSIEHLRNDFKQFTFTKHDVFHWSPRNKTIYYDPDELESKYGIFQLLHEVGHATLSHTNYTSGVQLLRMETQAWAEAQNLAEKYGLSINQKQIERCLDSYRDWLHLRSTCPKCSAVSLEVDSNKYHCFNCFTNWKVPADQRSKNYRLKQITSK